MAKTNTGTLEIKTSLMPLVPLLMLSLACAESQELPVEVGASDGEPVPAEASVEQPPQVDEAALRLAEECATALAGCKTGWQVLRARGYLDQVGGIARDGLGSVPIGVRIDLEDMPDDPWGGHLTLRLMAGGVARLASRGADGLPGTDDDLGFPPEPAPLVAIEDPLQVAAMEGEVGKVREALARTEGTTPEGPGEWPPLVLAARHGHEEVVALLLENGAAVDATGPDAWTPLIWASAAGRDSVVATLLEHGATLAARTVHRESALLAAACHGHAAVVDRLLAAGAQPDALSDEGASPLVLAAEKGHVEVVRLLHALDPARRGSALVVAAQAGHSEVAALLLEEYSLAELGSDTAELALVLGAQGGRDAIVRPLLAKGVDPNARVGGGMTPAMAAALLGHASMVALLLESGADAKDVNDEEMSVLSHAAQGGSADAISILLEAEAEVDRPNAEGVTPLFFAAMKGHLEAVARLVEVGANINAVDAGGTTAMKVAFCNRHVEIARFLGEAGAADRTWTALRELAHVEEAMANIGALETFDDLGEALGRCVWEAIDRLAQEAARKEGEPVVVEFSGSMKGYQAAELVMLERTRLAASSPYAIATIQPMTGEVGGILCASLGSPLEPESTLIKDLEAAKANVTGRCTVSQAGGAIRLGTVDSMFWGLPAILSLDPNTGTYGTSSLVPMGNYSTFEIHGVVENLFEGIRMTSDPEAPLEFLLITGPGLVHVGGRGQVELADGTVTDL